MRAKNGLTATLRIGRFTQAGVSFVTEEGSISAK
jgi:hypothetical protein